MIQSPVTSVIEVGYLASDGIRGFVVYFAIISIFAALVNLLPVPGFDGGQLVVSILEVLCGRKVTPTTRLVMLRIAVIILLSFTVVGFVNDALKGVT